MTRAILKDVERDGEILLLADGRRLLVCRPDDATAASIWMPSARLTVRERRRGAVLSITNEDTGETISAKLG
jgi:hypothetical protein